MTLNFPFIYSQKNIFSSQHGVLHRVYQKNVCCFFFYCILHAFNYFWSPCTLTYSLGPFFFQELIFPISNEFIKNLHHVLSRTAKILMLMKYDGWISFMGSHQWNLLVRIRCMCLDGSVYVSRVSPSVLCSHTFSSPWSEPCCKKKTFD